MRSLFSQITVWEHLCTNPADDPEARIRQLEQPLADTARASELGGPGGYTGYTPPPGPVPPPPPGPVPPPPPYSPPSYGYGGTFPGPTPPPSSRSRVFWILAAVFIIGMLALVGGIAVYAGRQLHRGESVVPSPTAPSISASFGPPRSTSSVPAPSTSKSRTPGAGPSTSPTAPAGSDVTISGINENKTITGNDNVVTVSGMSNMIVDHRPLREPRCVRPQQQGHSRRRGYNRRLRSQQSGHVSLRLAEDQ